MTDQSVCTEAGELISTAVSKLTAVGIELPQLEARILLGSVMQIPPSQFIVSPEIKCSDEEKLKYIALVERRKQCHFQSARRKNRFVILKYLGSHPVSIRNDVKQQCNSAFYWLYLNDRAWLEEKLPIACKPKGRY